VGWSRTFLEVKAQGLGVVELAAGGGRPALALADGRAADNDNADQIMHSTRTHCQSVYACIECILKKKRVKDIM
jgi:hypothetical protein